MHTEILPQWFWKDTHYILVQSRTIVSRPVFPLGFFFKQPEQEDIILNTICMLCCARGLHREGETESFPEQQRSRYINRCHVLLFMDSLHKAAEPVTLPTSTNTIWLEWNSSANVSYIMHKAERHHCVTLTATRCFEKWNLTMHVNTSHITATSVKLGHIS